MRRLTGTDRLEERLAASERVRTEQLDHVWELLDGQEHRVQRLERLAQVGATMAWIQQARLATEPLVSVVVPTRNRRALLERAIESVLAQSYERWELLICDDASDDGTSAAIASLSDPRIRYLEPLGSVALGAAATRNRGMDAARGDIITHLDDDNRMHRNWLKSVVWAFEQRPDVEVLYGGIVVDNAARQHNQNGHEMPSAWIEDYDPATIGEANVADTSAIAHRAGAAGARFDEGLRTLLDWDFIIRVGGERTPLKLPVVACFYHTDAEGRLTGLVDEHRRCQPVVQARGRRLNPT